MKWNLISSPQPNPNPIIHFQSKTSTNRMSRKPRTITVKWEIVYRDASGDYHRATGVEDVDSTYVQFYRRGDLTPSHKILTAHLYASLKWTPEQKVTGGLSAKIVKQDFVRY